MKEKWSVLMLSLFSGKILLGALLISSTIAQATDVAPSALPASPLPGVGATQDGQSQKAKKADEPIQFNASTCKLHCNSAFCGESKENFLACVQGCQDARSVILMQCFKAGADKWGLHIIPAAQKEAYSDLLGRIENDPTRRVKECEESIHVVEGAARRGGQRAEILMPVIEYMASIRDKLKGLPAHGRESAILLTECKTCGKMPEILAPLFDGTLEQVQQKRMERTRKKIQKKMERAERARLEQERRALLANALGEGQGTALAAVDFSEGPSEGLAGQPSIPPVAAPTSLHAPLLPGSPQGLPRRPQGDAGSLPGTVERVHPVTAGATLAASNQRLRAAPTSLPPMHEVEEEGGSYQAMGSRGTTSTTPQAYDFAEYRGG